MVDVDPSRTGAPEGDTYEWFHRAKRLLSEGNPDAAVVLLERVQRTDATPAVVETLGRALFEARRYDEAIEVLTELVEQSPNDDYAHYALGMALWRRQQFPSARDHLSMAFVMRPDRASTGRRSVKSRRRCGHDPKRVCLSSGLSPPPTERTRSMIPDRPDRPCRHDRAGLLH